MDTKDLYSASEEDLADTVNCFLDFKEMRLPPKNTKNILNILSIALSYGMGESIGLFTSPCHLLYVVHLRGHPKS